MSSPDASSDAAALTDSDVGGKASATKRRFTKVLRFDSIDSTNTFCYLEASRGEPEGLVAVASEQTAGRGRRDRQWIAPPGSSLLCSFLFRPTIPLTQIHLIPTIVALATHDIIAARGGKSSLKWPNDILIGEEKVAGILTERVERPVLDAGGHLQSVQFPAVVVGLGLNVTWPSGWPESANEETKEALASATTLGRATGSVPEIDVVLDQLIAALDERYARLIDDGQDEVLAGYREHCSTIGALVRIEDLKESFVARALDITDDGRLVIERAGRVVIIDSADVVHVRREVEASS